MNEDNPKFLNERELSRLVGISVQTLRNWRSAGKNFPYCKVGAKAIRYEWGDIQQFMNDHKIKPRILLSVNDLAE